MKHKLLFLAVAACLCAFSAQAQRDQGDSIDIIHTQLTIDFGNRCPNGIYEQAELTFVEATPCSQFVFDIICDSLFSVTLDGDTVSSQPFLDLYNNSLEKIFIPTNPGHSGDTHVLRIDYLVLCSYHPSDNRTIYPRHSCVDGGLFIQPTRSSFYNLGEDRYSALSHSVGRAWHPCRDNFYEKSTYDITINSKPGWHCSCSGAKVSETTNPDGTITSSWHLAQPAASYQIGIWAAESLTLRGTVHGYYRDYPLEICLHNTAVDHGSYIEDTNAVKQAFGCLDTTLYTFERLFAPYAWNRIGYVTTQFWCGMEHIDNIILGSYTPIHQPTIIHEFAHQWFGNMITCADEHSMWINEGGGTFCEEVVNEARFGKAYSDSLFQIRLEEYLLSSAYRSVTITDQPYERNMMGDTYYKGHLAWHMLRGYMGDSLFYHSMQRIFAEHPYSSLSTIQLQNLLSDYSGLDMTSIFDLVLNSPNYIDYQLETCSFSHNQGTVSLSQRLTPEEGPLPISRVPITFFSADRQQMADRVFVFSTPTATLSFDLPFTPAYVVVDYHNSLASATTSNFTPILNKEIITMDNSFCQVFISKEPTDSTGWVHIAHHYTRPSGTTPEGIRMLSNRFWQVTGNIPWDAMVLGRFLYNVEDHLPNPSSAWYCHSQLQYLDYNFYQDIDQFDSLALVYRTDPTQPWSIVSRETKSNSNKLMDYFITRLFPGQYALAIISDSTQLSCPTVADGTISTVKVYPNPANTQISLQGIPEGTEVKIFNMQGVEVLSTRFSGAPISIKHLSQGVYFISSPQGKSHLIKQ